MSADGREVIELPDLPVTNGLRERVHEFGRLDEAFEPQPLLDELAAARPSSAWP